MSRFFIGAIAALGIVVGSIAASRAADAGDRNEGGSGHCGYKRTTAAVALEPSNVDLASEAAPISLQQLTDAIDETVMAGVESVAVPRDEVSVCLVTQAVNEVARTAVPEMPL